MEGGRAANSSCERVAEVMVKQLQMESENTRSSKPQSRSRHVLRPNDGEEESGAEITAIMVERHARLKGV